MYLYIYIYHISIRVCMYAMFMAFCIHTDWPFVFKYRAPRASGDLTTSFQKRGMAEVLKVSDA